MPPPATPAQQGHCCVRASSYDTGMPEVACCWKHGCGYHGRPLEIAVTPVEGCPLKRLHCHISQLSKDWVSM